MNTRNLALDYLRMARSRLRALDVLLQEESHNDVVREAQEMIELMLKGSLRWVGIDPPKVHEVGDALKEQAALFPIFWQEKIDDLILISHALFEERSLAFYGDETGLIPASELFTREEAERARAWAAEVLGLYERLLGEKHE